MCALRLNPKTCSIFAATLAAFICAPLQRAHAGELYNSYGFRVQTYRPSGGYFGGANGGYRSAARSTAAARLTNPIPYYGPTPTLSPSGGYTGVQSNEYEGRMLAYLRAQEQYQLKLAAYEQDRRNRELEELKKREEQRAQLAKQREEQWRQQQQQRLAANSDYSPRSGTLWRALDKKRVAEEQTITEEKKGSDAEQGVASPVSTKKLPKQATFWERVKYVFLGA